MPFRHTVLTTISLITLSATHAAFAAPTLSTDNGTTIGNMTSPAYGPGYSAFWRNGAPDYSLLTDGTDTFVNAPSPSGKIYFRARNATTMILRSLGPLSGGGVLEGLNNITAVGGTFDYARFHDIDTVTIGAKIPAPLGADDVAVYAENTNSLGWAGYFKGRAFTTAGVWSASDARLKKDIKDAPYGQQQLSQLRPVTYRWKSDGSDAGLQIGLIAQEVQKVVPEVVTADGKSGMLSVNYSELIPVLIKANQEQQKTIERQDARIAKLERSAVASSMFSGRAGQTLLLALLPLGLIATLRARKRPSAA